MDLKEIREMVTMAGEKLVTDCGGALNQPVFKSEPASAA